VPVPDIRIRCLNARPERGERDFVLYWMTAFRRTRWNFALERAVEHARRLGKPLVVLEALRAAYPWASDRLHAFVIGGMRDNAASLAATGVRYVPYLEPTPGAGRGLLEALAERAAVVVTDDFPAFFLRRMAAAAATRLDVRLEAVDANGLLPLRASSKAYPTAFAFRAFVQKHLREHLEGFPLEDSLAGADLVAAPAGLLPPAVEHRWPWRGCRSTTPSRWCARRRAARARPRACWRPSSTRSSRGTRTSATSPNSTSPAGCRPTCTSGTCRCTRSSTP
jgi:deoxyribodipyrimidine photo-lyase